MELYPAIDLKGGRVVRWLERESEGADVYHDRPLEQALSYAADGASWLHVVDLDRAFRTGSDNTEWVSRMTGIPEVAVQVGGNVDTLDWASEAIAAGARRVVLGTSTLRDAGSAAALVERIGAARCAVSLDVRGGRLAQRGSDQPMELSVEDALRMIAEMSVTTVVYRDLDRDGQALGADIEGAVRVAGRGVDVILAGGVGGLAEIEQAARCGLGGVIVGRALYEGRFTLKQALECLR
jgi:phosphoribosylformimino-5-aminoimidazole carboxamide ribotide isomerase